VWAKLCFSAAFWKESREEGADGKFSVFAKILEFSLVKVIARF